MQIRFDLIVIIPLLLLSFIFLLRSICAKTDKIHPWNFLIMHKKTISVVSAFLIFLIATSSLFSFLLMGKKTMYGYQKKSDITFQRNTIGASQSCEWIAFNMGLTTLKALLYIAAPITILRTKFDEDIPIQVYQNDEAEKFRGQSIALAPHQFDMALTARLESGNIMYVLYGNIIQTTNRK